MKKPVYGGFKMYDPIEYKVDDIKYLFASILCGEKRSMNFHNAMFMVGHSQNLFHGLFKKNESIDRLVASINYNFNCKVEKSDLVKCKTLGDVVECIKKSKHTFEKERYTSTGRYIGRKLYIPEEENSYYW